MANVNADYSTILNSATEVRSLASNINTKLLTIYSEFKALTPNDYLGKSYNDSATVFNSYVTTLNEALTFFVKELPTSLEQWGNNLKAADNSESAKAAQEDSPRQIENISIGDPGTNPVFHSEKILDYRSNLESYSTDISNDIDSITNSVKSIVYGDEDDVSAGNISKVNNYSNTIREAIATIKRNIDTELETHGVNFKSYVNADQL